MTEKAANPHWGSTLDEFLDEEGIREEATTTAIKRVIAWQLAEEMRRKSITKKNLADLMHTSRAQIDRILDPQKGNVTIETLQRAAGLLGRQLRLELSAEQQSYMFDTVAFNRLAEGKIPLERLVGRRVIATGIQLDEIGATSNPERRARLQSAFEKLDPSTLPAASFAWDIEGAGLDQAYWNDRTGTFEKMLDRLKSLDGKSKKTPRDSRNQTRDILIAETAIKNNAVLVTDDANLRQVVSEFGGCAIAHTAL